MRPFTLIFAYLFSTLLFCCLSITALAQMEFVENKGQWHENVTYRGDFTTGSFFMENGGFTVLLHKPEDVQRLSVITHGHDDAGLFKNINDPFTFHSFAYKVKFVGASLNAMQLPDKMLPTHNNYYYGNERSKWASGCKVYHAVTYQEIYPNIDIRYYSDAGKLKYDFIVKPGGKVADIALQYEGPTGLSVIDKQLVIATPVGDVTELYPYTYQSGEGKRRTVNARYIVTKNVVTFNVDEYNEKETLVIDPSVIFSTFTGSTADNWGYTATPGPDGSFYAGGVAFAAGYPVSPGAYQRTYGGGTNEGGFGGYDVAIFKFSPNGSTRVYATYLGGSGNEQPHSMVVDAQGNLIVAGRTTTSNFPNSLPSVAGSGYDIFVTKFNASGTNLIGSIKMGGKGADGVNIAPKYPTSTPAAQSLRRNYGDDARSEVILDGSNNIYLVSSTQGVLNASNVYQNDFPIIGTVFQNTFGGGLQDGVVIKFKPDLSGVTFSSYFGGSANDACFVTSISPTNGDLYVAGATASTNLPGDKTGVLSGTYGGDVADGFVTQLKSDGSAIVRTTYQGTGGIDLVYGLKFDRSGFPYITGTTTGNWTVVNARFSHQFGSNNAKQFISKLAPDLSAYVYSTVFGTNISVPNLSPTAFLVDRCENVYVSGWGGGINVQQRYTSGTTLGLPNVNPLAGIPPPDGNDFYFFVLEKNANSQLFGSHFGQNGGLGDHVDGGTSRFDDNGVIYQAICANCAGGTKFPTTPGSWSTTNGSNNCNQASIKIEMNFSGVGAGVQASINAVINDTTGCVPLVVDFTDTLRKGKTFYWSFGDGSPDVRTTSASLSHTYTAVGSYLVRLIAEDSTTCNIRDTAFVTIIAGNNRATPDFTFAKMAPCESLTMQFTNTSTAVGNFGPRTFIWDYGDGSKRDTTAFAPARLHTYAAPGTYIVKLIILDTAFCNSPDSIEKTIRLNPLVKAQFETDPIGCVPFTATFENTSLAGTDFVWNFGDGTTSTDPSPTHTYTTTGTFNVRLIATDTNTCNRVDTSAFFAITVVANPTAQFSWQPDPPTENTPVQFTNLSIGATSYLWNFGDGDTSTLVNPAHQYNETGTYLAELIAYNEVGCSDTFRLQVSVIVIPLLDVPNAFIPAQGGRNSIVKVEGFGISKMIWKIYNRWGQIVFQSNNKNSGWNGYYKGKLQPTDVYAYTLDVEFTDGKKLRKTGDITLLR